MFVDMQWWFKWYLSIVRSRVARLRWGSSNLERQLVSVHTVIAVLYVRTVPRCCTINSGAAIPGIFNAAVALRAAALSSGGHGPVGGAWCPFAVANPFINASATRYASLLRLTSTQLSILTTYSPSPRLVEVVDQLCSSSPSVYPALSISRQVASRHTAPYLFQLSIAAVGLSQSSNKVNASSSTSRLAS